jgi:phage FluMu protein Com
MKRIEVRCAMCGKNLFFLLPECTIDGITKIEIKCYKDRCGAINIIDYQNPDKLVVTLKEVKGETCKN